MGGLITKYIFEWFFDADKSFNILKVEFTDFKETY